MIRDIRINREKKTIIQILNNENNEYIKNINGKYLQYYLIEKFRQDYSKIASGTTFSELKIVTLKNLLLPTPPIELQNKFAERIKKIEKLKFEIEKSIEMAQNLYNSLISKYFDN